MTPEIRHALLRVLPFVAVLFFMFIAVKRGKIKTHEIGLHKPDSWIHWIIWGIAFLFFAVIIEVVLHQQGILEIAPWKNGFAASIIRIAGAVIIAPIAEEIMFRGVLFNLLLKKIKNLHLAIFLQAVLFVMLHNFAYENTVSANIGIVQALVDASLFAYARHYTKSLYTPILMHAFGNFIAVFERFIF